jgi:hypothetical protein
LKAQKGGILPKCGRQAHRNIRKHRFEFMQPISPIPKFSH